MADLVRIRNLGESNLKVTFDSKSTIIPANSEGFVDREAACAHFGVWWAVPGGRPIDRKEEVRRVRGLYGCLPDGPANEHALDWETVRPKIEIFEMDGTKASTVIDDPEGQDLPLIERSDDAHLREVMAKMQEQMEQMQQQLDNRDQIIAAGTASELPAEDSPEFAPRRKRNAPEVQAAGGD